MYVSRHYNFPQVDKNCCFSNCSFRFLQTDLVICLFSFVVAGDDGFYVVHTAVAQLKSVPVENFVQRIGFREVQINYM